nr:hypothetical protein Iba_chr03dCG3180 [Ipomoea batatas]
MEAEDGEIRDTDPIANLTIRWFVGGVEVFRRGHDGIKLNCNALAKNWNRNLSYSMLRISPEWCRSRRSSSSVAKFRLPSPTLGSSSLTVAHPGFVVAEYGVPAPMDERLRGL